MDKDTEQDPRRELEVIEAELERLRNELEDVLRRKAERWDDPGDAVDHTVPITMAEELEAYITMLEARRRALQEQVAGG
jgi:hypothetical protein